MKRLTYKDENGKIRINCWNEDCHGDDYEDGDFCPGESKLCASLQNVIDKNFAYEALGTVEELAALKEAESEGRLVVFSTAEYADVARAAVMEYEYRAAMEKSEAAALAAMEGMKEK